MLVDIDIIMRIFYEKSTNQMSKNRGRTTTTKGAHASLVVLISFILSLLVKSFEEVIQPFGDRVDIARGYKLE